MYIDKIGDILYICVFFFFFLLFFSLISNKRSRARINVEYATYTIIRNELHSETLNHSCNMLLGEDVLLFARGDWIVGKSITRSDGICYGI